VLSTATLGFPGHYLQTQNDVPDRADLDGDTAEDIRFLGHSKATSPALAGYTAITLILHEQAAITNLHCTPPFRC
jgi:hypothetical protein